MTDKEINIAIAEICGWTLRPYGEMLVWYDPKGRACPVERGHRNDCLPNYTGDLNAMHEAEAVLNGYDKISRYVWELERLTFWQPDYREGGDGKQYISPAAYYCVVHATARQRAEAFLRAIGRWKE